ncbi:MAG: phosphotransferase family protein [Acidimicrobiia bacterium]|nr:phosphotransferase family protein [Acidimicrobiia bacterium]
MAVASHARDDEELRAGIERWLHSHVADLADATVAALSRPTTGLSSDTVFVTATPRSGASTEWVVRLPPAGAGLFPTYDLGDQVAIQNGLSAAGIPTAAPASFEPDPSWLGAPFMFMPRCAGRVVTTNPPYLRVGWLADAPSATQHRLIGSFLTNLAALHRLDPSTAGTPMPIVALDATLDRWSDYLTWAAAGAPIPGYLVAARDWCEENLPAAPPEPTVLWGDVQLANCVFDDAGRVVALLDFELAGTGPAEMDLGWFLALHEMTVALNGGDLPGFGDRTSMLATYETSLGRSVEDLRWYQVFALVRSGAIMVRIARILAAQGVDDSWLTRGNPTEGALVRVMSEE